MNKTNLAKTSADQIRLTQAILNSHVKPFDTLDLTDDQKQEVAEQLSQVLATGCDQPQSSVTTTQLIEALSKPTIRQWKEIHNFLEKHKTDFEFYGFAGTFYEHLLDQKAVTDKIGKSDRSKKAQQAFKPAHAALEYFAKSGFPRKAIRHLEASGNLNVLSNSDESEEVTNQQLKYVAVAAGLYSITHFVSCLLENPKYSDHAA